LNLKLKKSNDDNDGVDGKYEVKRVKKINKVRLNLKIDDGVDLDDRYKWRKIPIQRKKLNKIKQKKTLQKK